MPSFQFTRRSTYLEYGHVFALDKKTAEEYILADRVNQEGGDIYDTEHDAVVEVVKVEKK